MAESPVFRGLPAAQLELIAGCGQNTGFEAGDYLFREEGDQADTFYLLRHGRVQLEIFAPGRGAVTIQTVDEGDVVGWSWLFPPYRAALRRTRATSALVAFDGACLRCKREEGHHSFGFELLGRFSPVMLKRLQATRMQLLDVYGNGGR